MLSPWGQRFKNRQDRGWGAQASCGHTACVCAAPWSHNVAEPPWLFPRAGPRLQGSPGKYSPLGNAY